MARSDRPWAGIRDLRTWCRGKGPKEPTCSGRAVPAGSKLTAWTRRRFLVLARMLVIPVWPARLVAASASTGFAIRGSARLGHADRGRCAHAPCYARAGAGSAANGTIGRAGCVFGAVRVACPRPVVSPPSAAPAAVAEVVTPMSSRHQPRPRDGRSYPSAHGRVASQALWFT
jgi:hypothetical protein